MFDKEEEEQRRRDEIKAFLGADFLTQLRLVLVWTRKVVEEGSKADSVKGLTPAALTILLLMSDGEPWYQKNMEEPSGRAQSTVVGAVKQLLGANLIAPTSPRRYAPYKLTAAGKESLEDFKKKVPREWRHLPI